MPNVDPKISPKALSKKSVSCLISAQQTVFIQNRNVVENRRLISDIIESFLVTMDVKKHLTHWTINS